MTARLNDRELDALLAGWLDEGPSTAAGFVVEQALARVPTVRRRAGWWPQLPILLRTHGPLLAAVAVMLVLAAGVALAVGMITRPQPVPPSPPVVPSLDASASPTQEPSPSASEEARMPARATGELRGPAGTVPAGTRWVFLASNPDDAPVIGYEFVFGWSSAYKFAIFLDPTSRDWVGTWTTDGELRVVISWALAVGTSGGLRLGTFTSEAGECQVTFETFGSTAAGGSLHCADVPGMYANPGEDFKDGVVELLNITSFGFDPSWEPQMVMTARPTPSAAP